MASYEVQQGDCLSSIAARFGYASWKDIWDAPTNAAFKKKRKNPNVLFPGDIVDLPDHKRKTVSIATGKRHTFVVKRPKAKLKVRFVHNGKPLANEPYRLEVQKEVFTGSTDGDGGIEKEIPAHASSAKCTLTKLGRVYDLAVGALDPATELSGAQARLKALGAFAGDINGTPGDDFLASLRFFQAAAGLAVNGELDAATVSKLEELFGV